MFACGNQHWHICQFSELQVFPVSRDGSLSNLTAVKMYILNNAPRQINKCISQQRQVIISIGEAFWRIIHKSRGFLFFKPNSTAGNTNKWITTPLLIHKYIFNFKLTHKSYFFYLCLCNKWSRISLSESS